MRKSQRGMEFWAVTCAHGARILFNGKPKATVFRDGCHAVAFGLPLNDFLVAAERSEAVLGGS